MLNSLSRQLRLLNQQQLRRLIRQLIQKLRQFFGIMHDPCSAAFRNGNPEIRIFELDHPDTQRYKLERIRDLEWNIPENVRHVPIDFSTDDMNEVLERAGFDRKLPTFFSILGVLYYLTLPVFEQTLEMISGISENGNQVVFDFPDENTFSRENARRAYDLAKITDKLGEPMKHGFRVSEIRQALAGNRFTVVRHETPESIQKTYFDERTDGQTAYENIHFILAEKAE